MKLCRSLRWKSLYGRSFESAEQAAIVAAHNDVPFSCLKTCRSWGPDDAPASPECCGEGRSCFEERLLASRSQS